jgi:hypothetical protein
MELRTIACHLSLYWVRWIQSTCFCPFSLKYVFIWYPMYMLVSQLISSHQIFLLNFEVISYFLCMLLFLSLLLTLMQSLIIFSGTYRLWSSTLYSYIYPSAIGHDHFLFHFFKLSFTVTPTFDSIILYILKSNPHPFYSFRGLKNQMRIRFAI